MIRMTGEGSAGTVVVGVMKSGTRGGIQRVGNSPCG